MEPEKIEIKVVDESGYEAPTPEGFAPAKAGGKAEVTLRLLTQEEFDRREAEKHYTPYETPKP